MEENRPRAFALFRAAAQKGAVYGAFNAAALQLEAGDAADRGECIRLLNQAADGGAVAAATPGDTLTADDRDEEAVKRNSRLPRSPNPLRGMNDQPISPRSRARLGSDLANRARQGIPGLTGPARGRLPIGIVTGQPAHQVAC